MHITKLMNELKSEQCRCGRKKISMQTFCRTDYKRLPPKMQKALYNRVGSGYEEAYEAACKYLDEDLAEAV